MRDSRASQPFHDWHVVEIDGRIFYSCQIRESSIAMLEQCVCECMVSISIMVSKNPLNWYQNCNTNQTLISGGYYKIRESLYT